MHRKFVHHYLFVCKFLEDFLQTRLNDGKQKRRKSESLILLFFRNTIHEVSNLPFIIVTVTWGAFQSGYTIHRGLIDWCGTKGWRNKKKTEKNTTRKLYSLQNLKITPPCLTQSEWINQKRHLPKKKRKPRVTATNRGEFGFRRPGRKLFDHLAKEIIINTLSDEGIAETGRSCTVTT